MDSLPEDIFVEILFLLPVKSLLRFKLVCKSWRSRISNPEFVKRHVARTTNNRNSDLFIAYDVFYRSLSVIDVTIDRSIRLNCPIHEFSYVVGSCNGLLCLADRADELYLWNPVTRQVKHMHGYNYTVREYSNDDNVAFGFGFDHATRDYKAVRIVQKLDDIKDIELVINRAEVYSLNENCWKEINVELDFGFVGPPEVTNVNGSIYWLARKSHDDDFGLVVLTFDVQSLKFGTIQLPDDLSPPMLPSYWHVGVLQFKEYVALCHRLDGGGCVIYTLLDGNGWCKNRTIKHFDYLVGCLKTGELIGWKYGYHDRGIRYRDDVVLYDSVNDVVKSIQPIPNPNGCRDQLYHYTESLFDLN